MMKQKTMSGNISPDMETLLYHQVPASKPTTTNKLHYAIDIKRNKERVSHPGEGPPFTPIREMIYFLYVIYCV